jgi:toxin ParE1/3/4
MRRLEVTEDAEREIDDLLNFSEDRFGAKAAERYRLLIDVALADLLSDPTRPGVKNLSGIPRGIRLYPIRHSRDRVPRPNRVNDPRHVIAFRYDDVRIQVVHLLHDAMDLPARLR